MKTIDEVDDRERVKFMERYTQGIQGYDRCPWCDQDVPVVLPAYGGNQPWRAQHATAYVQSPPLPQTLLDYMAEKGLTPDPPKFIPAGDTCQGTHSLLHESPPALSERGKRIVELIREHVGWMDLDYGADGVMYGLDEAADAIDRELS